MPAFQSNGHEAINSGAFGGMGIIQLMLPPGSNQDSTNTVLDDNGKATNIGANEGDMRPSPVILPLFK